MKSEIYQANAIIRPAFVEDASQIARVDVDTWRLTYQNILPKHFLAELSYQKQEHLWRQVISSRDHQKQEITLVAENILDGAVVGFASAGPCRERDSSYRGELYTLYLLPSFHGKGIGKQLITKIAEHLLSRQMNSMLVWVLAENPTRTFYEACGASLLGIKAIWVGGLPVNAAAYGWKHLHSFITPKGQQ